MAGPDAKTQGERLRESLRIMRELDFMRRCPEFVGFRDAVNAYVRSGVSSSGRIAFKGTKRVLEYVLTTRADRVCTACLRYAEHV